MAWTAKLWENQELASAQPSPIKPRYRFAGLHKWLDPDGYPAVSRPWGTLSAINLNFGNYFWIVPPGVYSELATAGMKGTGTENYGGPIVTAGGLVFIGATNFDRKFRALDKRSGRLLWETTLPLAGNATASLMKWPGSSRRPSTQLAEKAGEKIRPAAFTLHSYYLRR